MVTMVINLDAPVRDTRGYVEQKNDRTVLVVRRMSKSALSFRIVAECPVSKARVSKMVLPHQAVDTPVFMPVGTQGTLKGVTSQQLVDMDCQIILGNTYHLGNRPVGRYGVSPPRILILFLNYAHLSN